MSRLSSLMLGGLVVATSLSVVDSLHNLPETVAVHFGANGTADGWTTREVYLLFVLPMLIGVPLILVWLMAGLPRLTNGKGQIPNSEYWFAPERRPQTLTFLTSHSCWLGCLTAAVIFGIHLSILRANATSPPALASNRFAFMLVIYLGGLVWWTATFLRHFQRTTNKSGR